MNWDAVGAIAESIGAIAVVGSLAFVGIQIRQSKKALKSAALREVLRDMAEATKPLSEDPSLSRIWWEGLADFQSLTKDEQHEMLELPAIRPLFNTVYVSCDRPRNRDTLKE